MSLYEGLGVETAPIPEITSQDDSSTATNLSERHTINVNANIERMMLLYLGVDINVINGCFQYICGASEHVFCSEECDASVIYAEHSWPLL